MPYRLLEEEEPSVGEKFATAGKEVARHGARTLSNVATRTVGLPGDIFSLINEFVARPASKLITGEEGVPYEETYLGKALPTTETHRKGLEEKTGEFLKPQNKVESFVDNVVEDASLLLNPTQLIKKGAKPALQATKKLAISLGANVAGETAEETTGSKTTGDLTKIGSLFLLSIINPGNTAREIGKLYRTAESKLPPEDMANAKSLEKNLTNLRNNVTKFRPEKNLSSSEKYVVDEVDKVMDLIHSGEINVAQAWAQKRTLNDELSNLYKTVSGRKEQKKVRNLAKQVTGFLNSAIKEYGKKNPEFYENFKNADEAFGTLARSNIFSNWVKDNVTHNPVTVGLMHLFSPIATGVSVAAVPYQASKLLYRIQQSPTLRKIYGNALKSASKEDAKTFNKYLKELDEKLDQEESEDRYHFID